MEITPASAALTLQASTLNAVRATLASAQQATTPTQHAGVILELSVAAQQLMTSR